MSALSQSRGSGGTLGGGLAAARRVDLHDDYDDGGFGFIGVYPGRGVYRTRRNRSRFAFSTFDQGLPCSNQLTFEE